MTFQKLSIYPLLSLGSKKPILQLGPCKALFRNKFGGKHGSPIPQPCTLKKNIVFNASGLPSCQVLQPKFNRSYCSFSKATIRNFVYFWKNFELIRNLSRIIIGIIIMKVVPKTPLYIFNQS